MGKKGENESYPFENVCGKRKRRDWDDSWFTHLRKCFLQAIQFIYSKRQRNWWRERGWGDGGWLMRGQKPPLLESLDGGVTRGKEGRK